MLAIVEIAGQQFNVEPSIRLTVNRLAGEIGDKVEFSNILAVTNDNTTQVGTPFVSGTVTATILEHGKGEKVRVFHKKRRKGYRKLRGFRPSYTTVAIESINI
ncbi:MAG: 50S ribosomal protein L21 [Candidatus Kapaibacteriota bacterium]|jgi:large subunit ribosomal protein L21